MYTILYETYKTTKMGVAKSLLLRIFLSILIISLIFFVVNSLYNLNKIKQVSVTGAIIADISHSFSLDNTKTHLNSVILRWNGLIDDNDELVYYVYLSNNPNDIPYLAGPLKSTNYNVTNLQYGQSYYWYIVASEGIVNISSTITTFDVINNNPSEPQLFIPLNGVEIHQNNIILRWSKPIDDDNDELVYYVYLSNNPNDIPYLAGPLKSTNYNVTNLQYGQSYYWYIVASDGIVNISSMIFVFNNGDYEGVPNSFENIQKETDNVLKSLNFLNKHDVTCEMLDPILFHNRDSVICTYSIIYTTALFDQNASICDYSSILKDDCKLDFIRDWIFNQTNKSYCDQLYGVSDKNPYIRYDECNTFYNLNQEILDQGHITCINFDTVVFIGPFFNKLCLSLAELYEFVKYSLTSDIDYSGCSSFNTPYPQSSVIKKLCYSYLDKITEIKIDKDCTKLNFNNLINFCEKNLR